MLHGMVSACASAQALAMPCNYICPFDPYLIWWKIVTFVIFWQGVAVKLEFVFPNQKYRCVPETMLFHMKLRGRALSFYASVHGAP